MQWIDGLLIVAGLVIVAALFTRFFLGGERLARYDGLGLATVPPPGSAPSEEHHAVLKAIGSLFASTLTARGTMARIAALRQVMDQMGDKARMADITLQDVAIEGMRAEWVVASGADPDRRLLYIHGGAWMMGSPLSHRCITTALSRRTGAAVLAIDYRLIPEHPRLACVEDCQSAYRWILENGPNGRAPVRQLFVAGDSAGGNLTLITIAWARDAGLRAADAVVALSPATDGTLSSPSLEANLATDHMLAPMFGRLARIPRFVLLWTLWLKTFIRPCDPRVSPAHGALHGLPPTLVHVSEAEMLLDDVRRYVRKAQLAGSPAVFESWPHMVHVWHFFEADLPEARDAFARIENFIEQHAPRRRVCD